MRAVAVVLALGAACSGAKSIPQGSAPTSTAPTTTELTTTTTEAVTTTEAPTTTTEAPARNSGIVESSTVPVATTAPARSSSATLASIRYCESRGDYSADTGNGYYGAYQFDLSTWAAAGGSGNPADASPAEQDARAQAWIDAGHRGAWPNC